MDNLGSWVRIRLSVIAKYKSWVIFSVNLHLTVAEKKGKNWLECCSVISGLRTDVNYASWWLSAHMMHCSVFLTWEKSLKLLPSSAFFVKTILCCGFRSAFKLLYTVWSMQSSWSQEKKFGTEHIRICYTNITIQPVGVFLCTKFWIRPLSLVLYLPVSNPQLSMISLCNKAGDSLDSVSWLIGPMLVKVQEEV